DRPLEIKDAEFLRQNGPLDEIGIDEVLSPIEFRDPQSRHWKFVKGSTVPSVRKNNFVPGRFKKWNSVTRQFERYTAQDAAAREQRFFVKEDGTVLEQIGERNVIFIRKHTQDAIGAKVHLPPAA
ncbi:MAG: hypothetical protein HOO67_01005, partial [Candidatus Peribacteraceae bacterium]|nr:hypothetical protein [Candidatus Peribacteraceae bacterium]